MSKEVVKLWVQFAKADIDLNLNTAAELYFRGHKWPPQDPSQPLKYFQLDANPKLIVHPNSDRIQFWKSLGIVKQY